MAITYSNRDSIPLTEAEWRGRATHQPLTVIQRRDYTLEPGNPENWLLLSGAALAEGETPEELLALAATLPPRSRVEMLHNGQWTFLGRTPRLLTPEEAHEQARRRAEHTRAREEAIWRLRGELQALTDHEVIARYGDVCLSYWASRAGGNCRTGTKDFIRGVARHSALQHGQHNATVAEVLRAWHRARDMGAGGYAGSASRDWLDTAIAGGIYLARKYPGTQRPRVAAPPPAPEPPPDPFIKRRRTGYATKRLDSKQAGFVNYEDGITALVSYGTIIGLAYPDGSVVMTTQKYSPTTSRHTKALAARFPVRWQTSIGREGFARTLADAGLTTDSPHRF